MDNFDAILAALPENMRAAYQQLGKHFQQRHDETQHVLAQQQLTINQQHQTILNLQNAPAPAPIHIPNIPTPARNGIKLATPSDFDGTREKALSFLRACHLQFQGPGTQGLTDGDKITFALSYMKTGTAVTWADHIIETRAIDPTQYQSWVEFEAAFRTRFADPNPGETARQKMFSLRQAGRSADVYVSEFEDLALKSEYDEVALLEKFRFGLDDWLRTQVWNAPTMPTTLAGWKEKAKLYQLQHDTAAAQKAMIAMHRPPPAANRPAIPPRPFRAPVAVTVPTTAPVSATRVEPAVVPMDLSRSTRSFAGKCWECQGPHLVADCPIRQAKKDMLGNLFPRSATAMIRAMEMEEASWETVEEPTPEAGFPNGQEEEA